MCYNRASFFRNILTQDTNTFEEIDVRKLRSFRSGVYLNQRRSAYVHIVFVCLSIVIVRSTVVQILEQPPPREVPSQENSFRFIIHSTERLAPVYN
jgi:hypothetical protein